MATTPAQFLVESLVADALLLGQWGAQEPLEPSEAHELALPEALGASQLPMEPEPPLSKADLRRKRNRERIQETRQAHRESMELTRCTVQQLTKQLHRLKTERLERSDRTEPSPEYAALVETTHRLKAEKVLLRRMLIREENTALRLIGVMSEINAWCPVPDPVEAAFGEFSAITPAQALASITNACRSFALYEQWATPVSEYIRDASAPPLTFGWTVTCALEPDSFYYLAMTKKLPGVKAQQAMRRSWSVMSRPYVTDESPSLRIAQSVLLQRLDSSTCVMGSDWFHPVKPGVCMRSISVRQCQATESGFAIKQGTLNPQDPELRHQVLGGIEYMDALNWHSFTDEEDGSGCVATLKVLWLYDTLESMHLRVVNALSAAWRWESGFNDSWRLLKM